jgi:hypothetical protein
LCFVEGVLALVQGFDGMRCLQFADLLLLLLLPIRLCARLGKW